MDFQSGRNWQIDLYFEMEMIKLAHHNIPVQSSFWHWVLYYCHQTLLPRQVVLESTQLSIAQVELVFNM